MPLVALLADTSSLGYLNKKPPFASGAKRLKTFEDEFFSLFAFGIHAWFFSLKERGVEGENADVSLDLSKVSSILQSSLSLVMDDTFCSNSALLSVIGCGSGAEQLGGA